MHKYGDYKYNDYIRMAKGYLRNYIQHQQAVKTITEEIEDIRRELAGKAGKLTASYSAQAGGGFQELNGTESAADRCIDLRVRIAELYSYRREIVEHLERMDRAVLHMTEEERQMVRLVFYDRKSYRDIAEEIHSSERSCQRCVSRIAEKVAEAMFGELARKEVKFAHG